MKKASKHEKSNARGAAKFKDAIAASTLNGSAPGHKRVERKRYTKALPVKADPEEVAAMAEQMAKLQLRKNEIDTQKSERLAEFREELSGIKSQLTEFAESVSAHTKTEEIEVVEYLDEATGGIRVIRQDTNEQIEYRQAEKEDLQESMFDSPKAAKAKKGEEPAEAAAP